MALVRWNGTIVDQNGNVQAGAEFEIRDVNGALATIYEDRAQTAKSNPFTADAEGFGFFYAQQGRYTINATSGALAISWQDVELASSTGGRDLDTTQTGPLIPGSIWGIDATAARSRALPSSPDDGEEIGFYVRGNTGDVRNNNATITVLAPDSINGAAPGGSFVIDNTFLVTLKYNATDSNWELINDSLATGAGEIVTMPFRVTDVADTGNIINAVDGSWQRITLTANRDFTFDLKAGEFVYVTVVPGAFTLSFTNVSEWFGGSAPTSIGAEAAFVFHSDDGVTVTGDYRGDIS